MKKVFLDPGHGGSDPGAVFKNLIERDINLVSSFATKEFLESHSVEVKISRTGNGNYVGLQERCDMANNWGADLFISEHENAGGADRGEVIYSIYHGVGETLANNISNEIKAIGQTQITDYSKQGSNGDYYAVIRGTHMPAVITEGCFLDNESDNDLIDTVEKQKAMGVAIAKGILKTLGINYNEQPVAQPIVYVEPIPAPAPEYDFSNLQASIGVSQDNVPGPITLSKCPLVKNGASGPIIGWIQRRVNFFGFNPGDMDWRYGPNSMNAVKAFQASRGLSADGIVGQNTWRKLLGL